MNTETDKIARQLGDRRKQAEAEKGSWGSALMQRQRPGS